MPQQIPIRFSEGDDHVNDFLSDGFFLKKNSLPDETHRQLCREHHVHVFNNEGQDRLFNDGSAHLEFRNVGTMVPGRHVSYPAPPFENTATWRDVAEKACAIIAEQSRGFLQCPDLVAHFPSTAWISSDPWLKQGQEKHCDLVLAEFALARHGRWPEFFQSAGIFSVFVPLTQRTVQVWEGSHTCWVPNCESDTLSDLGTDPSIDQVLDTIRVKLLPLGQSVGEPVYDAEMTESMLMHESAFYKPWKEVVMNPGDIFFFMHPTFHRGMPNPTANPSAMLFFLVSHNKAQIPKKMRLSTTYFLSNFVVGTSWTELRHSEECGECEHRFLTTGITHGICVEGSGKTSFICPTCCPTTTKTLQYLSNTFITAAEFDEGFERITTFHKQKHKDWQRAFLNDAHGSNLVTGGGQLGNRIQSLRATSGKARDVATVLCRLYDLNPRYRIPSRVKQANPGVQTQNRDFIPHVENGCKFCTKVHKSVEHFKKKHGDAYLQVMYHKVLHGYNAKLSVDV